MVVAHLTSRFSFPILGLVPYLPLFLCLFLPHLLLGDLFGFLGVWNLTLGVWDYLEPTILALGTMLFAQELLRIFLAAMNFYLSVFLARTHFFCMAGRTWLGSLARHGRTAHNCRTSLFAAARDYAPSHLGILPGIQTSGILRMTGISRVTGISVAAYTCLLSPRHFLSGISDS